jgi:hypothetical protein
MRFFRSPTYFKEEGEKREEGVERGERKEDRRRRIEDGRGKS